MPDFVLHADGVPFTVTANSRQEAAQALADEIDRDPSILKRKQAAMDAEAAQQAGSGPADAAQLAQDEQAQAAGESSPLQKAGENWLLTAYKAYNWLTAPAEAKVAGVAGGVTNAALDVGSAVLDGAAQASEWTGKEDLARYMVEKANRAHDAEAFVKQQTVDLANQAHEYIYGEPVKNKKQFDEQVNNVREVSSMATKLGTALPGASYTLAARGAMRMLGAGALEGGLMGYLYSSAEGNDAYDRFNQRMGQAAAGGAIGAGFAIAPAAFTGAYTFFARQVQKVKSQAREGFELADQYDLPLTFGQASGNTVIQKIEQDAQGDVAQNFYRQQAEAAAPRLGERLGLTVKPYSETGVGTGVSLDNLTRAVEGKVSQMKAASNQAWKQGVDEAQRIAGDAPVYDPTGMVDMLKAVKADLGQSTKTVKMSAEYDGIIAEMENAVRKGGASAGELNRWWNQINTWKRVKGGMFSPASEEMAINVGDFAALQQTYAGRLSGNLSKSLDEAQALSGQGSMQSAALDQLKQARSTYKAQRDQIRMMEDDFLKTLRMDGTPQQVYGVVSRMDPDKVRNVVNHIRQMDGGEVYLKTLKDSIFDTIRYESQAAAKTKGFKTGEADMAGLLDAAAHHTQSSVLRGLLTPAEERIATDNIKLWRRIVNAEAQRTPTGVVKTTLPLSMQDMAINAVSRNAAFVARLGANVAAKGKGAEFLLFTKEGQKMLMSLQPEGLAFAKTEAARNAAIMYMLGSVGAAAQENADASIRTRQQDADTAAGRQMNAL